MSAQSSSRVIEVHAVLWGTFSAAVFAVPVALAIGVLDRNDNDLGGITSILKILLFASPLSAGFAGGRTATTHRAANGALSGAATFILVQLVYSLAGATAPNPLALVYLFFIGACLGTMGGLLASRWAKADEPRRPLDEDHDEDDDVDDNHPQGGDR